MHQLSSSSFHEPSLRRIGTTPRCPTSGSPLVKLQGELVFADLPRGFPPDTWHANLAQAKRSKVDPKDQVAHGLCCRALALDR